MTSQNVIDLVSSDEEDRRLVPAVTFTRRTTRAPLTPRKFVPTPVKTLSFTPRGKTPIKARVFKQLVVTQDIPSSLGESDDEIVEALIARTEDKEVDVLCDGLGGTYVSEKSPPAPPSTSTPPCSHTQSPVLTQDSPILSPPLHATPLSHESFQSPLVLPATSDPESESEDDWIPTRRTPWKGKKRIVNVDSESESEPASPIRHNDFTSPRELVDLTGTDDEDDIGRDPVPGLFDHSDDEEEEEEDEDVERDYDIGKHYDESYGSLRDFIVDDSDLSEEGGSLGGTEEEEEDESETRNGDDNGAIREIREVYTIDDTDDEEHDILHYSPAQRLHTLPDLNSLTLDDSPGPSVRPTTKAGIPTPSKTNRRSWESERAQIAQKVFDDLNHRVFEGKLSDCPMEWSKRLLTTAGQAKSQRSTQPDGTRKEESKIILSEKVLTGKEQILCTVAHEMCHLACWIISNERRNPHGRVFKSWGRKVMKARPDIETTHSYVIEYKYEWKCTNALCGKIYRRHSKSIDQTKHACGSCKSRLEPLFQTKTGTPFQLYLKENMGYAKMAMPKESHGGVMRALSRQWNAAGPDADHLARWKALAAATT